MLDGPRPLSRRLFAGSALAAGFGLATSQAPALAGEMADQAALDRLEIDVVRAEDVSTIKNIQRAYGHYADRGLWDDLADLFDEETLADYPSGIFLGKASTRDMFFKNLGAGQPGLAEGRIYNHIILQPVIDLAPDGVTAVGRWRVLGMLGRFGANASWADSIYRFDYAKVGGKWKIKRLVTYGGSGGGYENGWTPPVPRPPGFVDTSPVVFNLPHPADRPRSPTCDGFSSACPAPFPYANPGLPRTSAPLTAVVGPRRGTAAERAADLIARAQRLEDEQTVLNLLRAYGYYLDRGQWAEAASLFAPDGTREVGQAGVYVGRDRIRRSLELMGPQGLRPGQLNDYLQVAPVVSVAPDGLTAKARIVEIAMIGGGGEPGRLVQNIEENDYVRRAGVWMIQAVHSYTILDTEYDQGWAKSAIPAAGPSPELPPDRPPTVVYKAYPAVFIPAVSFNNPSTGRPAQYPPGTPAPPPGPARPSGRAPTAGSVAAAARQARRVMDHQEIENLQNAYGYYLDKFLAGEAAKLFTADGVLEVGGARSAGHGPVLAALGALAGGGGKSPMNSQLQLQPVITVSPDGRTGKVRARLLQLSRDASGQPMWGGGVYESDVVKQDGVWRFRRQRFQQTFKVNYKGGWAKAQAGGGQVVPARSVLPFHYRNPVTGRA